MLDYESGRPLDNIRTPTGYAMLAAKGKPHRLKGWGEFLRKGRSMIELTIMTLAGLWRIWDGESWSSKIYRQIALLGIFAACAWVNGLSWQYNVIVCAIAWWAIEKGFHDWTSFKHMAWHYTRFGLLMDIIMYITAGSCILLTPLYLLAGLAYPTLAWLNVKHYDFYARLIAGALVVGSIRLL